MKRILVKATEVGVINGLWRRDQGSVGNERQARSNVGGLKWQIFVTRMLNAHLVTSLLLAATSTGAFAEDLIGKNCDLKLPPLTAGYSALMGMPLRIYPSHELISSGYSGCQVIWVTDDAVEKVEMKILFEHGKPKRMVGGNMNMTFGDCKNASADTTASGLCDVAATFPYESYAKECLKTRTEPADSVGSFIDPQCMQPLAPARSGKAASASSKP